MVAGAERKTASSIAAEVAAAVAAAAAATGGSRGKGPRAPGVESFTGDGMTAVAAAAGGVEGRRVPLLHQDGDQRLAPRAGGCSGGDGSDGTAGGERQRRGGRRLVPLLHPEAVSGMLGTGTLAGGNGNGDGGVSSGGGAAAAAAAGGGVAGAAFAAVRWVAETIGGSTQRRRTGTPPRRADCLVEIASSPQPTPSSPRSSPSTITTPIPVMTVLNPGGEGVGAPLRVTVGRVSAFNPSYGGGGEGNAASGSEAGGSDSGGGGGGAGLPVIVLEVSVVGDTRVGRRGTGEFAEALKRRLLAPA